MRWNLRYFSTIIRGTLALTAVLLGCSSEESNRTTTIVSDDAALLSSRPNVVLIMADDMGWGDTGYSGNETAVTPNLDAMAANAVRFDRFYSASPVCSPTRGSVLTGRHPYRYGVYFANVGHLPNEELTLADVLREAGYRTGFFGKWHLGTLTQDTLDANRGGLIEHAHEYSPPWLHGFDEVFATESKTPTYDPMIMPKGIDRETWWDNVADDHEGEPFGTYFWNERGEIIEENLEGDDSRVIVDRAIPFIRSAAADDVPFLAVIWTHAPHFPVVAAPEDRAEISASDPFTSHYFGSILALDRQVGRVRDELQTLGISQQTLVWFTSDNGPEHLYDGAPGSTSGLRGAKRSLYEGGIRVPGILEWPTHVPAGSQVSAPAVTSDIFPTVLDYLGLSRSDSLEMDGISLRPLISGERNQRGQGIGFESNFQVAFVSDRFKLIHQPTEITADPSLQGTGTPLGQDISADLSFELYDLVEDPEETTELDDAEVVEIGRLLEDLDRWRQSIAASIERYESREMP